MSWSKKQLISICSRLRDHILARELAGEDELLDYWPADCGCAATRDTTCGTCTRVPKHEWYMAHSQLVRMNGRDEWYRGTTTDAADRALLQQLNEDPVSVRLLSGHTVQLYPKGYHALMFIQNRDWLCSWLAALEQLIQTAVNEQQLTKHQLDSPISTLDMIADELAHQMAVILNVAMYEGPSFDPIQAEDPPDWLRDMMPIDIARLNRTFFKINLPNLTQMPYLVGPRKPGKQQQKRAGWSVFYSRAGKALGVDPQELMRNKSLAALLVHVNLSQQDHGA